MLTPHQALTVAVRLFAILVALYAGREMAAFFITDFDQKSGFAALAVVFSVLSVMLVIVLWLFPRSIARNLLPLSVDAPAPPTHPDAWIAVGASLIGLWLIADALPGLMRNSLLMLLFRAEPRDISGLASGLLYYALQFVVGVALLFGANGIKRFILWARYAGTGGASGDR
jgi:hypothetical protein